ncbi:putative neprosin [Arabidopsis thaliana]
MKMSCWRMLLFLLGYILYFYRFVDAEILQTFSDFEIEEQLKVVNKPATKIIKVPLLFILNSRAILFTLIHGDSYDCVDFYKQPAFDHPLMKNHLFHYKMRRPSSLRTSRASNRKFGYLWKNGIGCPIGTVPIKKIAKDELLKLNLFSNSYNPRGSWNFTYNQYNVDNNQHHFAVSRTKKIIGKIYNGATMILSINDPKVKPLQYSSARMHVQIGDDFIQAGWTVNQKLYSDNKTRSYVYTKIGENQCYNSMCPAGIIMVSSDIALGLDLGPPCVRGSRTMVSSEFGLLKNKENGDWWLKLGGQEIGYWPAKKFKETSANNIEWGGEVYSAFLPSPQMGNGHFPETHIEYDAIIFNITIVDENFKSVERIKHREAFSDNTRGYKVYDDIYVELPIRNAIYYGGPGNI